MTIQLPFSLILFSIQREVKHDISVVILDIISTLTYDKHISQPKGSNDALHTMHE